MGQITNYTEKKVLDHALKTASYSPPATVYLALFSATPGPAGGGTECVYTNYARQAIAFSAAASRTSTQSGAVTFPQCGVTGDTAAYWGIFDTNSGGNLMAYGSLAASKSIVNGNTPSIATTQTTVSWNAGSMFTAIVNTILDWLFRAQAFSQPTNVKVGLSTTTPADDGTNITEPSGNNYSQQNFNTWNAAAGNPEAATNNGAIVMPTPSGSWGLCTYSVLYLDANKFAYGTIPSQTPGNGDTVEWLTTQYSVSIQ